MKSGNSPGVYYRHFDALGGVFTQPDGEHTLLGRVGTTQLAVASVRSSDDPFKTTTGEKIFFGVFLLLGLALGFFLVVFAALGIYGHTKKLLAQLFLWGVFWVGVLFVVVFLAKTFWNWLP
jgi:hypothetical protein